MPIPYRRENFENLSPIGQWIIEYCNKNNLTLTALARQAGLSSGTIREIVFKPSRVPRLETCVRLADVTSTDLQDVLSIAGVGVKPDIDPQWARLADVYQRLSPPNRELFIRIGSVLADNN